MFHAQNSAKIFMSLNMQLSTILEKKGSRRNVFLFKMNSHSVEDEFGIVSKSRMQKVCLKSRNAENVCRYAATTEEVNFLQDLLRVAKL